MVHLLRSSQYFLHSHKNQKCSSVWAGALACGLWQEVKNICGFRSHDILHIKHNPTARSPSLKPFPYKSPILYSLSLHTLVAALSISQMVFIHRQKTPVFFLHYLPVHLQTCGVLQPYELGKAQHQQHPSFPNTLSRMISVNGRENTLTFTVQNSTKRICFVRQGGKM